MAEPRLDNSQLNNSNYQNLEIRKRTMNVMHNGKSVDIEVKFIDTPD